ncbi:restriction endonuclease subunit S [Shewanella sp. 0m-8]
MADSMNLPEIRFKGFDYNWDVKTLGGLAVIVRGASPRPIDDPKWFDSDSHVGWLRISDVTKQDGRIHYLEQRISKAGEGKTRVLTEPHLLLSIAASVGKPVVNYVSTGVHDGFLIFQNPTFNREFMFQWMKMFEGEWQKYGQPGSQVNLNSEIVKNQEVGLPRDGIEQSKIGSYFQHIDKLVALHQAKYGKLTVLKKAMLEKMFPKEGADVPEVRFKGVTDGWVKRRLLSNFEGVIDFRGRTPKKLGLNWSDTGYLALSALNVKNGYIDLSVGANFGGEELYDKWMSGSELHKNQVLFTTEAPMGNVAQVPDDRKYILSQRTIAFKVKPMLMEEGFLAVTLRTPLMQRKFISLSSGGTAQGISQKSLETVNVVVPKSIVEQSQIGSYFQNLDKLISLQQQELTKLKNLKKACLDKMFV